MVVTLDNPPAVERVVDDVPPFGRADLPRDQRQEVETWDLVSGSHLMIAGTYVAPIYDRDALTASDVIEGPAIVEEAFALQGIRVQWEFYPWARALRTARNW